MKRITRVFLCLVFVGLCRPAQDGFPQQQSIQPIRLRSVLEVGQNPHQIAFSRDGATAYVAAAGSNWVTRIDVASLTITGRQPVPDGPLGVVALSGDRIAVSRFRSDRVTRYPFGSHTADGHIVTGGAPSLLVGPVYGGGYLVSSEKSNRLWWLDLVNLRPLQSQPTGARPFPPAVTADGAMALVPNYDDASVSVLSLAQRRLLKTIPVGKNPSGGAVLPGDSLYAVAVRGEDHVALIDLHQLQVVRRWREGIGSSPFSVVPSADGRLAFINNTASHTISVYGVSEEQPLATVPVGEIPIVMAVHPSGSSLWVSSEGSHTLSVFDLPRLPPGKIERIPVDVVSYQPRSSDREAAVEMKQLCEREILDLHRFFQDWLTGAVARESGLNRLEKALTDGFEIISPSGHRSRRKQLLQTLATAYATYRDPPLRIWVENIRGRALANGVYLATYEEWQQQGEQAPRGRLSTALFRRDPRAPGGVRWIHVHETWLP